MPEHMGVNRIDFGDFHIKRFVRLLDDKINPADSYLPSSIMLVILWIAWSKISPNAPVN